MRLQVFRNLLFYFSSYYLLKIIHLSFNSQTYMFDKVKHICFAHQNIYVLGGKTYMFGNVFVSLL